MITFDTDILAFLAGLTQVDPEFGETSRMYLSRLAAAGNAPWGTLPFGPGDLDVFEDRLPLVPLICNGLWNSQSPGLAAALSENHAVLARDSNMHGKTGWFVLRLAENPELDALAWMSGMARPFLVVGSDRKGGTAMAAPMARFF